MYIDLNVSEATIERVLNKTNRVDTEEYGIIRINRQSDYWVMNAILGRGMKNRPELLWKIEVVKNGILCSKIKTYKERIYFFITAISSLLVPIALFGLLTHLLLITSNKIGMPFEAIVGVTMYLLIVVIFWGIYYYVFIRKSNDIIKDVITKYIFIK